MTEAGPRQCPFERRYLRELADAEQNGDVTAARWMRVLLEMLEGKHVGGGCVCRKGELNV